MQCQRCSQKATVHLTEIIDGTHSELHLCAACAAKEGLTAGDDKGNVEQLIDQLDQARAMLDGQRHVQCPKCGNTWAQFRKDGLLGCPHDYEVFKDTLAELIRQAQDGNSVQTAFANLDEHSAHDNDDEALDQDTLPSPNDSAQDREHKLQALHEQLQQAVAAEDYERAAALHKQIDALNAEGH